MRARETKVLKLQKALVAKNFDFIKETHRLLESLPPLWRYGAHFYHVESEMFFTRKVLLFGSFDTERSRFFLNTKHSFTEFLGQLLHMLDIASLA